MKYKLCVFDVDGTITTHPSSWQFLHEKLGQWDNQAIKYQEMFLAGKISYKRFCKLDALHWKGMDIKRIIDIFEEITYARNVKQAIEILKNYGFKLAAISTGIQFLVDRVKKELDLDYAIGNRLIHHKGKLSGEVEVKVTHLGKGRVLNSIIKRFGTSPAKTIVVGDSKGDIPMMKIAGFSFAFNSSNEEVKKAASFSCFSNDFLEVCQKILEISGLNMGW